MAVAFKHCISGRWETGVTLGLSANPSDHSDVVGEAVKDLQAGKTLPRRIVTGEGIFPMEVAAREFPKRRD